MKKRSWALGIVLFGSLFLTLTAVGFYLLFRSLSLPQTSVSSGSTLTIDTARSFPEDPLYDLSGPFLEVQDITFRDLIYGIRSAKEDERVERLLLVVRGLQMGWAAATELRAELIDFKESGKPLVAFLEYAGSRGYFVASAADEVYLHPQTTLDLRGIMAEVLFIKSTLDKLGIEAEFERIGAYKNAPDSFLRDSMSEAQREALTEIVETLHETMVSAVAESRGISSKEAEAIIDKAPLTAETAEALRLVDGLKYRDEVESSLEDEESEEFKGLSIGRYTRSRGRGSSFGKRAKIAVIYGLGAIVGGSSTDDLFAGRVMGSDTIAEAFKQVREDDSVDAVVFRIDSPGGSDVASDVIWREATLTREKKPVVVSMGNVAASGGYWIATASDAIVAEPTTITGSIGIYAGTFNFAGFYDTIGFNKEGVASSTSADFFSDSRSFTEQERQRLRKILEKGYNRFLERVATARDKTKDDVHAIAQGRIWSGRMALKHGLVDELGGLDRGVRLAQSRAGFHEDDDVQLVIYPRKKSYFQALLSNLAQSNADRALSERPLWAPPTLPDVVERSPFLQLLLSGKPLALMPYQIELR